MRIQNYCGRVEVVDLNEVSENGSHYHSIMLNDSGKNKLLTNVFIPEDLRSYVSEGREISLSAVKTYIRKEGERRYSKMFVIVAISERGAVSWNTELLHTRGVDGAVTSLMITASLSSFLMLALTGSELDTVLEFTPTLQEYLSNILGADVYYHLAIGCFLLIIPTLFRLNKVRNIPKRLLGFSRDKEIVISG